MYKFNKSRTSLAATGAVLVSLAILLASQTASAGLDKLKEKSKGKTKPTDIESMARVPDKDNGNVFKCWQEGRLIYKQAGLEVGSGKLPGATQIKSGQQTVQVLDLKQGVCILLQAGAKDE